MGDALSKDLKIYIAGHLGLVGSAMVRALRSKGYARIVTRTHNELELTEQAAVARFFAAENPDFVVLAAAKVGGIMANETMPAEFIYSNIAIQTNIIQQAHAHGVKRLLFLGSSCIYPRDCPQPIKEEYFLTGPLEETNRPYAIAKIAGVEMCSAYNRQFGTRFMGVMPTNLYGIGDNFDLNTSHVMPALIRKAHIAKIEGHKTLTAWGSGTPRREFLISDDLATACLMLLETDWQKVAAAFPSPRLPLLNIGSGNDVTIAELTELVARTVGFEGDIIWDRTKPDGTPRKLLDVSRIKKIGWKPTIALEQGVAATYRHFINIMHTPAGQTGNR